MCGLGRVSAILKSFWRGLDLPMDQRELSWGASAAQGGAEPVRKDLVRASAAHPRRRQLGSTPSAPALARACKRPGHKQRPASRRRGRHELATPPRPLAEDVVPVHYPGTKEPALCWFADTGSESEDGPGESRAFHVEVPPQCRAHTLVLSRTRSRGRICCPGRSWGRLPRQQPHHFRGPVLAAATSFSRGRGSTGRAGSTHCQQRTAADIPRQCVPPPAAKRGVLGTKGVGGDLSLSL